MPVNRSVLTLALLAVIPGQALAHGEGVLLVPLGTLAAVALVLLVALLGKARWPVRLIASLVAVTASLPVWFIPSKYFPSVMRHADWGYFVTGFIPPLIAGALVVWLFRRSRTMHNGA